MSNVKVKEDIEKLYLENYKLDDAIKPNKSNSPIVIRDLHHDTHSRKVFLGSINKEKLRYFNENRKIHSKSMNYNTNVRSRRKSKLFQYTTNIAINKSETNSLNPENSIKAKSVLGNSHRNTEEFPNIYNLKNILAYNQSLQEKELLEKQKNKISSVINK